MKREEIRIRDPFILPYEGKYYMYGTGIPGAEDIDEGRQFWCYMSEDLEEWSEPILCFDAPEDFWGERNFWAPEVHFYNEKFYMLASFIANGRMRATQALVADKPQGPFRVVGKPLTPSEWSCLDGTLYVEEGIPYLVFCHEWLQVEDGEIAMIPLKEDLSEAAGEAKVLFSASESGWAHEFDIESYRGIVTDGPWLVKEGEELLMFWSSYHHGTYAVGMSVSESGKLVGPWRHSDKLLFEENGGHGMMFQSFDEKNYFVLHRPNNHPEERANFFEVVKDEEGYRLVTREKETLI